tara:strand:- start:394 stop:855 length:462 start_codon:yes stop_codon:yes gene_type:complete
MKIFLIGILAVFLLGILGFVFSLDNTPEEEQDTNQQQTQKEETTMTPTEFQIEDLLVGDGKEAIAGTRVAVHYTGTLVDGTKFDSSVDRGQPFQFDLGARSVIQGWDQGVAGMKVGGKRKLTIPPDLGYGGSPGHRLQAETLIFEVELLDVIE